MGAKIIEAIISGFTSGGTGLASGTVSTFDAMVKTTEGALTGVAEVGFALMGFGLITAVVIGLWRKLAKRV